MLSLCGASSGSDVTVNNGGVLIGTGSTASVTVNKGGMVGAGKTLDTPTIGKLSVTGNLNVKSGGVVRTRVRKSSSLRCDALKVGGKVTLASPVFSIELLSGSFSEGDVLAVFVADGGLSLTGTPVFEPAVPGAGLQWDASSLSTDGCIRVVADPVGINEIRAAKQRNNDEIFDLSGRRMRDTDRNGVYIVNGKKILK